MGGARGQWRHAECKWRAAGVHLGARGTEWRVAETGGKAPWRCWMVLSMYLLVRVDVCVLGRPVSRPTRPHPRCVVAAAVVHSRKGTREPTRLQAPMRSDTLPGTTCALRNASISQSFTPAGAPPPTSPASYMLLATSRSPSPAEPLNPGPSQRLILPPKRVPIRGFLLASMLATLDAPPHAPVCPAVNPFKESSPTTRCTPV